MNNTIDELQIWFDTEIGHGVCPEDETPQNCKYNGLKNIVNNSLAVAYKKGHIDGSIEIFNKVKQNIKDRV